MNFTPQYCFTLFCRNAKSKCSSKVHKGRVPKKGESMVRKDLKRNPLALTAFICSVIRKSRNQEKQNLLSTKRMTWKDFGIYDQYLTFGYSSFSKHFLEVWTVRSKSWRNSAAKSGQLLHDKQSLRKFEFCHKSCAMLFCVAHFWIFCHQLA